MLYDVERENILQHGYGMHSFANALVICFEKLSVEPVTPELHSTIREHRVQDRRASYGVSSRCTGDLGRPVAAAPAFHGDKGHTSPSSWGRWSVRG